MSNHEIVDKIDRLGDLFADIASETTMFSISPEVKDETDKLMEEVVDYLVNSPGTLFYDNDHYRHKRSEAVVELLWKVTDSDEVFDQLLSGGSTGLFASKIRDYSKRVRMLKPTFTSIDPENTKFSRYFEEAMNAWLHGLPNAALIISFAILEDLLKDGLRRRNPEYVYDLIDPDDPKGVNPVSNSRIIKSAFDEGLIDEQEMDILNHIRKLRNDSLHNLDTPSDEEVYEIIIQTKEIVESLLQKVCQKA